MKKMEVSKRILVASWLSTIILTAIAVIGSFSEIDSSNLTTLAGMGWTELTAAHGFYYWKAKNENRAKGTQKLIKKLADKHGIEAVARLAEIIFKD